MATLLIGPTGRNPDRHRGEHQYARINLAQTAVLVSAGGGQVVGLTVGVVGTLAKFYDVAAGGTLDDTTQIATYSLAALGDIDATEFAFSQGLTVVVTGAADITVYFDGANTVSPRTFPPTGRGGALYY